MVLPAVLGGATSVAGLAMVFAVAAAVYGAAGFGGGSTYLAVLTLVGADPGAVPVVALACNVLVAGQGSVRHARAGTVPWGWMLPLLAVSMPAAWWAAQVPVPVLVWRVILGSALGLAGGAMVVPLRWWQRARVQPPVVAVGVYGAVLGALAGVTGIGGGVFLGPSLHAARWGTAREVAGCTSVFIVGNSLAGLWGRAMAGGLPSLASWWPLPVAVLLGGWVGTWLGVSVLSGVRLRQLMGAVVLLAGVRLLLG